MTELDPKIEKLAVQFKKMELEALDRAKGQTGGMYTYWDAKAQSFSQCWEYIVFDGKSVPDGNVHPTEYNRKSAEYCKKVRQDRVTAEVKLKDAEIVKDELTIQASNCIEKLDFERKGWEKQEKLYKEEIVALQKENSWSDAWRKSHGNQTPQDIISQYVVENHEIKHRHDEIDNRLQGIRRVFKKHNLTGKTMSWGIGVITAASIMREVRDFAFGEIKTDDFIFECKYCSRKYTEEYIEFRKERLRTKIGLKTEIKFYIGQCPGCGASNGIQVIK